MNNRKDTSQIPCRYFVNTGICRKQDTCQFLHDIRFVKKKVFEQVQKQNPHLQPQNQQQIRPQQYTSQKPIFNNSIQKPNTQIQKALPKFAQPVLQVQLLEVNFLKFLPLVQIQATAHLGILTKDGISFYSFTQITSAQRSQLKVAPHYEIREAWIQEYQQQHILMICCKKKNHTEMRDLLIYLDVFNLQYSTLIYDVSLVDIIFAYLSQYLFVFCGDGKIRIFGWNGLQFVFNNLIDCGGAIRHVKQLSDNFLIALKDSQLMTLQHALSPLMNNIEPTDLKDIAMDEKIYLLYGGKQSEIHVLQSDRQFRGPVFNSPIKYERLINFRNYEAQNILMCANEYGYCDFLVEDGEFVKVNSYPRQIDQNHPAVWDMQVMHFFNSQNVHIKYIAIGYETGKIHILQVMPA